MKEKIVVGPLSWFFTNVNDDLALPGHSHFAHVSMHMQTMGNVGFPAFEDTYALLVERLKELGARPWRNTSNEKLSRELFSRFASLDSEVVKQQDIEIAPASLVRWMAKGCSWRLVRLDLDVRGVPDRIGHADGFTRYTVEADDV